MEYSLESADRIGLVLDKNGRENNGGENNNFASLELLPIILPLITDDFRSRRGLRLRLTGNENHFVLKF